MKHSRFASFLLFLLFTPFTLSATAAPADQLSQSLAALDNPDPSVREQARQNLMALHRSDLDALRQIIAQSPRLSPEQVAAVHEIVTQVILADSAAQSSNNGRGFLGAQPVECQAPGPDGKMRPAILIAHRVAGFDAYRMLRTGDIILAIDGDIQPTQNLPAFMTAIESHAPGDQLQLQLLRGGKTTEVTVHLFARPTAADNINLLDMTENPQERIEQYWRSTFQPIINKRNGE